VPPKKRQGSRARARTPEHIPCSVHVQRGGVQISVEHVMLAQAADVACYLLDQLQEREKRHPELARPHEVVQIGGYSPLETTDDDTWARRQVGFSTPPA